MAQVRSPSLFDRASEAGAGTAASGRALFTDGKAPDALRTIGEVATALGIRQHVLRYWEEQFPMLRPLKRSGARRYYRPGDIALVQRIDRLVHHEGYTLRGAKLVLQGRSAEAVAEQVPGTAEAHAAAGSAAYAPDPGLTGRLKAIRARLADAAG